MSGMITTKQTAAGHAAVTLPPERWQFEVRLMRGQRGPVVASVTATDSDLLDAQCELWRDECLRKGRPDVAFEQIEFRLAPHILEGSDPVCDGFMLRARMPFGTIAERQFGRAAFTDVALRAQQPLIKDKVLGPDDTVWFDIRAAELPAGGAEPELAGFEVESDSRALDYLTVSLPTLLQGGRKVGVTDNAFPVIYTEEALARSEQFARRGALFPNPIETGGVLIGPLVSCRETGEFFPVISMVLEVQDAEAQQFSLSYSGKSWSRIQAIVQAMQTQPATRAHRILGQCHGHNFPPAGGAPPCEACYAQSECHRRSDSASPDDRLWGQAVFSRQPWQICHIYGSNARKDNVQSMYTLSGNRLQARGYYVIPNLQARWETALDQ